MSTYDRVVNGKLGDLTLADARHALNEQDSMALLAVIRDERDDLVDDNVAPIKLASVDPVTMNTPLITHVHASLGQLAAITVREDRLVDHM